MPSGPFVATAEAIAARLEGWAALSSVEVMTESHDDLGSRVQAAINKQTGRGCVVVSWIGRAEVMRDFLRITGTFAMDYIVKPTVKKATIDADEVVVEMIKAVHLWEPDNAAIPCYDLARCGDVDQIEAETQAGPLLIYRVPVTIAIQL